MQKLKSFFIKTFKTPMLIIFIIICLMFVPNAINLKSVGFRSAIVVALGIDKAENNQIKINAVVNIPSLDESLSENSKVISAQGETINDGLSNLTTHYGRAMRLGHIKFILVSETLAKENLIDILDRLVRSYSVRNTVQLLMCKNTVSEVFDFAIKMETESSVKMSEIIGHQQEYSTTNLDSNVDSFYKGYLSKSKISKINCISLQNNSEEGISNKPEIEASTNSEQQTQGQGNQPSSSNKGENSEGKYVSNIGEVALFYNGRLKYIVPSEIMEGVNWVEGTHLPKKLFVQLKNDKDLNNAKVFFHLVRKNVKLDTFFYKGKPILSVSIRISIDTDEINNSNKIIPITHDYIDWQIKNSISNEIRSQIRQAVDYSKSINSDLLELNDLFYLNNHKDYSQYIKNIISTEDFINNVLINVEVSIRIV